ncbi:MAG: hypothetical protein ABI886_12525 [Betaproteobacteria bacterium]
MESSRWVFVVSTAALALTLAACEPQEVKEARHRKAAAEGRAEAERELAQQDEAVRRSVAEKRERDLADADAEMTKRLVAQARATLPDPAAARFDRYFLNVERTAVCGLVSVRDSLGRYGDAAFFISAVDGEVAIASNTDPLTDADVRLIRMGTQHACQMK